MGLLSWPGKNSDVNETVTTTGAEYNPEGELVKFKKHHKWDPFLEIEKLDAVENGLATGDIEKEAAVGETLLLEDSPYAEVRASVNTPKTQLVKHRRNSPA